MSPRRTVSCRLSPSPLRATFAPNYSIRKAPLDMHAFMTISLHNTEVQAVDTDAIAANELWSFVEKNTSSLPAR